MKDRAILFLAGKRKREKTPDPGTLSFPGQTHCLLPVFLKPLKACVLLSTFLHPLPGLTVIALCNVLQYTKTGGVEEGNLLWFS